MASSSKNIQVKLVLLGDMGIGKTSLVLRFVKGQFFDYQESTIGAALFTQVISLNEGTMIIRFTSCNVLIRLAPMYYSGAAAAVVVYDITSMKRLYEAQVVIDAALDEMAKWEQRPLLKMKSVIANRCHRNISLSLSIGSNSKESFWPPKKQ